MLDVLFSYPAAAGDETARPARDESDKGGIRRACVCDHEGVGSAWSMGFILWIVAVVLVIVGVVELFLGQIILGIVLIVLGFLVGPGGFSIFRTRTPRRSNGSSDFWR